MVKSELVERVSAKTGMTRKSVSECIDTLIDTIKETVAEGEEINLRGFGKFIRKRRAAKVARNIKTGTSIHIAAHDVPAFVPSNDFKDLVG